LNDPRYARLAELLRRDAVKLAPPGQPFTLASGKPSTWFCNAKEVTLRAEGLALAAELMLARLAGSGVQAVGGMTLGADPIIGAVVALSAGTPPPLSGFIVRKAAKDHGLGDRIAGPLPDGLERVAMLEDVSTTGGTTLDAIAAVRAAWPEGAVEAYAAAGCPFEALLTKADLGI